MGPERSPNIKETTSTPLDVGFKIALLLFLLPITCAKRLATAARELQLLG